VERRLGLLAKHLHGAHRAEGGETRAELVVEELARESPDVQPRRRLLRDRRHGVSQCARRRRRR